MKRYLRLFILLIALTSINVNAKTIDLKGERISQNTIYESGDIIKNANLGKNGIASFNFPYSHLVYIDDKKTPDKYTTYVGNDKDFDVFDIKGGIQSDLILPKVVNKDMLWIYKPDQFSDYGIFSDLISKPELVITCDDDTVNYPNKTTCSLYYKFGQQMITQNFNTDIDLTLHSDDYNISNIKTNDISSFLVNGNNIKGIVIDEEKFNDKLKDVNSYEKYVKTYEDNLGAVEECIFTDPTLPNNNVFPQENKCYVYHNFNIKLATFDITPKEDSNKKGEINIPEVNINFIMDNVEKTRYPYKMENIKSEIPIIGTKVEGEEVKGVEEVKENPNTGISNYIILLPLVFISAYVYHFIKKNKELFR